MKTFLRFALLAVIAVSGFGCTHNYYNVPRDTFEKKVRVLGVATIFVDADSDIRHPEREALVSLVKEFNRKNEKELAAMVRDTGAFFAVRYLPGDPDQFFPKLFYRRERRDDAGVVYNKYFFKGEEVKELIKQNNLDALMLVTVSGLSRRDKVYSGTLTQYLEGEYNYLIMTAQILDGDGTLLWEYPNFRRRIFSFPPFLPLQYPDFDEANANLSEQVDVKFKTMAGIKRAFEKREKDFLLRELPVSTLYHDLFQEMVSLLRPERKLFGGEKKEAKKEN